MNALVTIIVPLFNRAELIRETIDSILKQTSPNWELIIVDDGSTDGADGIAKAYAEKDHRIKLFYREREPKGAPTCRNIGVEKSTGEYLIFLDSDDLLAPWCVEKRLLALIENPDADFLVFPMQFFDQQPGDTELFWNQLITDDNDLNRFLNADGVWQTTGPIWKKSSLLNKIGLWDENLKSKQDYEFSLRAVILSKEYLKIEGKEDCYYRRYKSSSISRDVSVNKGKIDSWLMVFLLTHQHLSNTGLLTKHRKKQLVKRILQVAFVNYLKSSFFFDPTLYMNKLSEIKVLSYSSKLPLYSFLYTLYVLDKFNLRTLGLFLFNKVHGRFFSDINYK